MFPGINPKQMEQAMRKMGIRQETIDAYEVVIKTKDKNLIIRNPGVVKIKMPGNDSLQITGEIEEESVIKEEDVNTVAAQANVDKGAARKALEKHQGDLAAAILDLSNK